MFFILPIKVFPCSLGLIYSSQPNRSWKWVPPVAHLFKGVSVQIHAVGMPAVPQEVWDVPRCPAPPGEEPWGWGAPQEPPRMKHCRTCQPHCFIPS